ncbi:MAG: ECF transporter S component [Anaerolineae bacterium]|jgi:energy-coupling factor transport system substrate-specific component
MSRGADSQPQAVPRYYFTTRDLMMMAALAALGGVSSVLVNTIGDALQAALGFAGSFQFAAGLHVLWLVLAACLVRKPGAATVAGLLKGAVELLSGNTHGVIILPIDLVAGLLIDLVLLSWRDPEQPLALMLAGGFSATSNVIVFQFFASLPEDLLALSGILVLSGIAFVSGALLGGLLPLALLVALRKSGVVRDQPAPQPARRYATVALGLVALLAVGAFFYLRSALAGPPEVQITGLVESPYAFRAGDLPTVTIQGTLNDVTRTYTGARLWDIIQEANPSPGAASALIKASDGYDFFLSFRELRENPDIVLAQHGEGENVTYEVAGPASSKAWVRNVVEIELVAQAMVQVTGALDNAYPYVPGDWVSEMDNARIDFGQGEVKLQGVPLGAVLMDMDPQQDATTVVLRAEDGSSYQLPLSEAMGNAEIRLYSATGENGLIFLLAHSSGEVYLVDVTSVEVR